MPSWTTRTWPSSSSAWQRAAATRLPSTPPCSRAAGTSTAGSSASCTRPSSRAWPGAERWPRRQRRQRAAQQRQTRRRREEAGAREREAGTRATTPSASWQRSTRPWPSQTRRRSRCCLRRGSQAAAARTAGQEGRRRSGRGSGDGPSLPLLPQGRPPRPLPALICPCRRLRLLVLRPRASTLTAAPCCTPCTRPPSPR